MRISKVNPRHIVYVLLAGVVLTGILKLVK